MKKQKWTNQDLKDKALKYKTRAEFQNNEKSIYNTARNRGILDEICSHMPNRVDVSGENNPRFKWTGKKLRQEALKYKTKSDFRAANYAAYQAVHAKGMVDIACSHMEPSLKYWTEDSLLKESLKYKTKGEFESNSRSAYLTALKRKLISKICAHMPDRVDTSGENNSKFKWTDEKIKKEASRFSSRTEFANGSSAYYIAANRGTLDTFCSHMKQPTGSKEETQVLEFLQTINSDFQSKRFGKDYQIDCYSESLKLGVEYNGLYWHSVNGLKKGRPHFSNKDLVDYHLNKTKYFENLGIRIIHIWEHEWRDRKEQVKDFLKSACGANENKIGARKCEFKEVTGQECRKFLDDTHIQGGSRHVLFALGCFYNDTLIGVCSFGRHHRKSDVVTLNRFACLPNYTVSGFLSKASKIAFNKFNRPIISWADFSKSQARGYISAGWAVEELLKPDYFYFDPKTQEVKSKQSRKKGIVKTPIGMTEKQHSEIDGLVRIYDCGKIRLIYNPPVY
jgi:hypothetical protein